MKTLTICGSMRFLTEMQQIAWDLETKQGYNILQCIYGEGALDNTAKKRLENAHYKK